MYYNRANPIHVGWGREREREKRGTQKQDGGRERERERGGGMFISLDVWWFGVGGLCRPIRWCLAACNDVFLIVICIATHPSSGKRTVPPNIVDSGTTDGVVAREGSNVSLSCRATGHPEPNITWRREDGSEFIYNGQSG